MLEAGRGHPWRYHYPAVPAQLHAQAGAAGTLFRGTCHGWQCKDSWAQLLTLLTGSWQALSGGLGLGLGIPVSSRLELEGIPV